MGTLFEVHPRYMQMSAGPDVLVTAEIITHLQRSCTKLRARSLLFFQTTLTNVTASIEQKRVDMESLEKQSVSLGDQGSINHQIQTPTAIPV